MVRVWTRCRTVALRLRDSRRDVLPPPRAALHLGALRRWCLSQTAQTREALPPYATLQHRASTLIIVEEIVPLNAEKVNGLGGFSRDSPSAARKPGHRPTDRPPAGSGGCGHPPLRRAIDPVRRAGCPHPAKPGGQGGMWACRPTRFSGGMARIGGVFGRIYNPPLHARTAVSRCRGAFYMRPDCTAGPPQACEETELPYGRPYRPPLRRVFYLVRRAGCPHPAKSGRRDHLAHNQRISAIVSPVGAAVSRPDCTNGGLIQFIHSSFKECLLFCYWSFKIFHGFSGMIMPSGGHK